MWCKRVSISTCTPDDRCSSTPWRFPGCIGCRRSPTASAVDAPRPFGYRIPGSGSTPLTRPNLNPEEEGGSAARPQAAQPNACRSTVTTGKARTRLMARPSRTAQSSSRTRRRRCSWSTRPGRVWQCQRLDPHPGQALRAHPDQPLRRSRRRVSLTTSGREASTRHLPRRRTCLRQCAASARRTEVCAQDEERTEGRSNLYVPKNDCDGKNWLAQTASWSTQCRNPPPAQHPPGLVHHVPGTALSSHKVPVSLCGRRFAVKDAIR